MAGNYHFEGNPNTPYANATNSHYSGGFTDSAGAVTGCTGSMSPSINMREMNQSGGQGYGMSLQQPIAGFNRIPTYTSYSEIGVPSSENLGASTQYDPSMKLPTILKGGKGKRKWNNGKYNKMRGGNVNYSYGYDGKDTQDVSMFSGSGYPPISVVSQNLSGGKKKSRRIKKHRKSLRSRRSRKVSRTRRVRICSTHHKRHSHKSKKHRLGLKRKTSTSLFKKLIGGNNVYKGGYNQFMGDQAFSQGYELNGSVVSPQSSALANPIPFRAYNHCSDAFGK
jgi:hypothetical protein